VTRGGGRAARPVAAAVALWLAAACAAVANADAEIAARLDALTGAVMVRDQAPFAIAVLVLTVTVADVLVTEVRERMKGVWRWIVAVFGSGSASMQRAMP
jgi:hypothetical protein